MPPRSANDALTARFRDDCLAALGRPLGDGEWIALAVSGGPDSMAMLSLAATAFPGQCRAATVDHGLRASSAEEAAMVARYADTRGASHATLLLGMTPGANLQADARTARYAVLRTWADGAAALLTAHHADDQAETFLMRAARASGVSGLAGVRVRRDLDRLPLIRPLLSWSREELRAFAVAEAVPFVDDPSNADPRFDRTHARRLLAAHAWLDPRALARSAAHAAEAEAALSDITEWLARERRLASPPDEVRMDMGELPREIRRRLAREAIGEIQRNADLVTRPSANVESLLDALDSGKRGEHNGVLVTPNGTVWRFRSAPARRSH